MTIWDFMPIRDFNETRKRMSDAKKGKQTVATLGKPRPPHIKAILKKYSFTSESVKGEKNPFYGKRHSEENRENVGLKTKTRWQNPIFRKIMSLHWKEWHNGKALVGRVFSKEHKDNLRESLKDLPKKYYNTKPERMMQIALTLNEIKFEKHKPFKIGRSWHRVDIFIEPNICVEVDGVYWHMKNKEIKRDLFINQELTVMGYHIIRIRDTDILKNANDSAMTVFNLIKQISEIPNLREVI